jgi:hypothetical protein
MAECRRNPGALLTPRRSARKIAAALIEAADRIDGLT